MKWIEIEMREKSGPRVWTETRLGLGRMAWTEMSSISRIELDRIKLDWIENEMK